MRTSKLAAAAGAVGLLGIGTIAGIQAIELMIDDAPPPPPGLARPTSTPDARNVKDAAGARDELAAADPELGKLVDAVHAGDIDTLLALIDWETAICGERRDLSCGDAAPGTALQVVNVGWPIPFMVPESALRPALEQALRGEAPRLRFAAQSAEAPSVYFIGFDGTQAKGKGIAPLADSGADVTGLFFTVDIKRETPVFLVETGISTEYSAIDRGQELRYDEQRRIAIDDEYRTKAPSSETSAVP